MPWCAFSANTLNSSAALKTCDRPLQCFSRVHWTALTLQRQQPQTDELASILEEKPCSEEAYGPKVGQNAGEDTRGAGESTRIFLQRIRNEAMALLTVGGCLSRRAPSFRLVRCL
eukprot:RCo036356